MPIYEYGCQACGKTFEYQQKISDAPKQICEECGGALEKLISQTSFTLKGGGWYSDLYSSPKPKAAEKASGESSGTGTGTGTGTATKTETKTPKGDK